MHGHRTRLLWYACRNIYKNSLIRNNAIRFAEDIRLGEDWLFNLKAFLCATRAFATDERLYHYRLNSNSSTGQLEFQYCEYLEDSLTRQYEEKASILEQYTDNPAFLREMHMYVCSHTMFLLLGNVLNRPIDPERKRADVRRILSLPMMRQSLAAFSLRHPMVTRRQFAVILFAKFGLAGLAWYAYRWRFYVAWPVG